MHPLKALFWKEQSTLLLADFHLGKASHFRKHGIAVPQQVMFSNNAKFVKLIKSFSTKKVIFLGDLFHSDHNEEWERFGSLLLGLNKIKFELVSGNHDIMDLQEYKKFGIEVFKEPYEKSSILLSHHPMENIPNNMYNLAGHIHPGVRLRGKAHQSLRLPCFYFSDQQGLLPAFGKFTGTAIIRPKTNDKVFAPVSEDEVISL